MGSNSAVFILSPFSIGKELKSCLYMYMEQYFSFIEDFMFKIHCQGKQ